MITVLPSGVWQLSSVIVESAGECLMVDPAYFPRELVELRRAADAVGRAVAVACTHLHWDHIVGWDMFPEAEVWASAALAGAIAEGSVETRRNLAKAADFDARWYVERPRPLAWPKAAVALREDETRRIGQLTLRALALPGHSADGLGLLVEELRTLIVGDHLSVCEIPFVEDLSSYRDTLKRLLSLLDVVDDVIPGHGPRLSRAQAEKIAREDLAYLDAIALAADRRDVEAARAIALPRAQRVPGMSEHHRENCEAAGLSWGPDADG